MNEASITIDCHYPDVLKALLQVMPCQIDDPIDSDIETYYFPNHLTLTINLSSQEVTLTGAIDSDAAGIIMEHIETTNAIDQLEWTEVIH
jgi:hypothetical protein